MKRLEVRAEMSDETNLPAEAFVASRRLFDVELWKYMLHILEQEQVISVCPQVDEHLLKALEALQVRTRDILPIEWAIKHATLGIVYTELGYGASGRKEVLELALEHYQEALQILTEESFPGYWAVIQQRLCVIYLLKDGNRADNLQQSIVRGQAALRVLTRMAYPFEWAGAHTHLGEAYRQAALYAELQELYSGRSVMQEQALRHLEAAQQVYTVQDYPLEWAKVQRFQGMIYLDRVQGKRNENLARSRSYLEAALRVFRREVFPLAWVETQTWLGFSVFWQSLGELSSGD